MPHLVSLPTQQQHPQIKLESDMIDAMALDALGETLKQKSP